jgi:hypothetical protein
MPERLVLAFALPGERTSEERSFMERARLLIARADARSGELCAWSAGSLAFSFPVSSLGDVISLARTHGEETAQGERPFASGLAQGELSLLGEGVEHGELAWGAPLVAATALCLAARAGEVLVADSVKAQRTGELITGIARTGAFAGVRVRGAKLDAMQPFRAGAEANLSHLYRPDYLTIEDPASLVWMPGTLSILRADPGMGGSRLLAEVQARVSPAPVLCLRPAGSSKEPLGALRQAIVQAHPDSFGMDLLPHLEMLSSGDGVTVDAAARLITSVLWPKGGGAPGALLVDDALAVDDASLRACAQAVRTSERGFTFVVRVPASAKVPGALAELEHGPEVDLQVTSAQARELALGMTRGLGTPAFLSRWLRLGGGVPLAIFEAAAYATTTGELYFQSDKVTPRRKSAGRGAPRAVQAWITLRAQDLPRSAKMLLGVLAWLGGAARKVRLVRVLERLDAQLAQDLPFEDLARRHWLDLSEGDHVLLPSSSHKAALRELLTGDDRLAVHRVLAQVLSEEGGHMTGVEAAEHFAAMGDTLRAAELVVLAAKASGDLGLSADASRLWAYARSLDAGVAEAASQEVVSVRDVQASLGREVLETSGSIPEFEIEEAARVLLSRAPAASTLASIPPVPSASISAPKLTLVDETQDDEDQPGGDPSDSEPPTLAKLDLAPMAMAAMAGPSIPPALAKTASELLVSSDLDALESFLDAQAEQGLSPVFLERMWALARIRRGEIGEALRSLRRLRTALGPQEVVARCRTSLALGVALAMAGRPDDALLEGLDALARAKDAADAHGVRASMTFLAKLFDATGRNAEALRLRPPS